MNSFRKNLSIISPLMVQNATITTSCSSISTTKTTLITTSSSLSYRVCRTSSNQLPIYHLVKNGGNKKMTRIRKVHGNLQALRNDLRKALKLDDKECTINSITGHVIVKGHKKQEIAKFLTDQKF